MPIDFRRMRHVVALAELGSFARAATALGLSQPALSRSIQSVENEVGSRLFLRKGNGTQPTDNGHVLITRMRQIMDLSDSLEKDVLGDRLLQGGQIHVGSGGGSASTMVANAVARYLDTYPGVAVRVMLREWDELLRPLRAREIELFVAESSTFGRETDVELEPLPVHQLFIIGRRGHPLAGRTPVSFVDGLPFPYISLTQIPPRGLEPMRAARRALLNGGPGGRPFPALTMNSFDAVKRIVAGSDALMVVPLSSVENELEQGTVVALGSEPYLVSGYGIVKLRSQPLSTAADRFRRCILEAERSLAAREEELLERHGPRPASATSPTGLKPTVARARRHPPPHP